MMWLKNTKIFLKFSRRCICLYSKIVYEVDVIHFIFEILIVFKRFHTFQNNENILFVCATTAFHLKFVIKLKKCRLNEFN